MIVEKAYLKLSHWVCAKDCRLHRLCWGNPEVLLLDEPTNGLDPQGISDTRSLIKKVAQEGVTIIMASHLLDEVEKVCTDVAILKAGNLLVEGKVENILFEYILAYFLNTFLLLNFAYFLSTLVKRAGLAIGLFLLYYFVIENIIAYFLPYNIGSYLPMKTIKKLTPNPLGDFMGISTQPDFSVINMGLWVFYLCLFIGLNYWMLKRGHTAK